MTIRNLRLTVALSVALTTATVWAQVVASNVNGDTQAATGSSPAAWVYVASTPQGSNTNQIVAYTAAANGSLTPIAGSPFPDNVTSMAVNGKYLMAASITTPDINAYNIASDGSLSFSAATDYGRYNNPGGSECGNAGKLFFDHTGASLYVQEFNGSNSCSNTVLASFTVVKASGGL